MDTLGNRSALLKEAWFPLKSYILWKTSCSSGRQFLTNEEKYIVPEVPEPSSKFDVTASFKAFHAALSFQELTEPHSSHYPPKTANKMQRRPAYLKNHRASRGFLRAEVWVGCTSGIPGGGVAKAKWVGGSGGKGERGRETERGVEQTTLPSSDWGVQGSLS